MFHLKAHVLKAQVALCVYALVQPARVTGLLAKIGWNLSSVGFECEAQSRSTDAAGARQPQTDMKSSLWLRGGSFQAGLAGARHTKLNHNLILFDFLLSPLCLGKERKRKEGDSLSSSHSLSQREGRMEELHRRVGPLFILPAEGPQQSPPNTFTISI